VERDGRDLEAEPHEEQRDPGEEGSLVEERVVGEELGDPGE